jgi:hypothetical protein
MKKLQRRQQQNSVNDINEKKPKKKITNDGLLNQYMFDDEGENIGKSIFIFNSDRSYSLYIEDSRCSSEESIPHSISNGFGSSNDENNKLDSGILNKYFYMFVNLNDFS